MLKLLFVVEAEVDANSLDNPEALKQARQIAESVRASHSDIKAVELVTGDLSKYAQLRLSLTSEKFACGKCGRDVNGVVSHCPYCGAKFIKGA